MSRAFCPDLARAEPATKKPQTHQLCPGFQEERRFLFPGGVTLGEGGVGGPAALAEADGGAVVSLSFLGAQRLHGWVGRPEPQERGGHPWGLLAAQHHLLQGRGLCQEFQIPLHGAHVVLGVDAAQGGVLIQGIDFPWDKKTTTTKKTTRKVGISATD